MRNQCKRICWSVPLVLALAPAAAAQGPAPKITPAEVEAGLKAFWAKTALADGSFRPGTDPDYKGMSDSALSDMTRIKRSIEIIIQTLLEDILDVRLLALRHNRIYILVRKLRLDNRVTIVDRLSLQHSLQIVIRHIRIDVTKLGDKTFYDGNLIIVELGIAIRSHSVTDLVLITIEYRILDRLLARRFTTRPTVVSFIRT